MTRVEDEHMSIEVSGAEGLYDLFGTELKWVYWKTIHIGRPKS